MYVKQSFSWVLAGAMMLAWTGSAVAQDASLDLSTPAQVYAQRAMPMMLAASDTMVTNETSSNIVKPQEPFEPALISGSNTHLVLGLATIAAAVATAATAPEEGCEHNCPPPSQLPPRETNGTHAKLAKATVALAAATIASGLIFHWDDFHLEDGLTDPDNLHVLLGVTGAALMAYAVNKSANSSTPVSHAGIAEMGALGMAVAIKMTW
jgi:hypothetical protein